MKSKQQKKQDHLNSAKVHQAIGLQNEAADAFSKACEIHLKLSDKNKAQ